MIARAWALPLIPDGAEGRERAARELADPRYAAAEATPIDRLALALGDALESLFGAQAPPGLGPAILVGLAVLAIVLIAVAFAVWGRPRLSRRAVPARPLFGEEVVRTADELRKEATQRAAAEEWDTAIVLRFRALARSAVEKDIVPARPGATAQGFARAMARAFPEVGSDLRASATTFDDVRYLRRPGHASDYARVVAADDALADAVRSAVSGRGTIASESATHSYAASSGRAR